MKEEFPELTGVLTPDKWSTIRDVEKLVKASRDKEKRKRDIAVGTLGRLARENIVDEGQLKQVTDTLAQVLKQDESVLVRTRAAQYLLDVKGASVVPSVATMLRAGDILLMPKLVSSLVNHGGKNSEVFDVLIWPMSRLAKKEVVTALLGLEELGDSRKSVLDTFLAVMPRSAIHSFFGAGGFPARKVT